MTTIKITDDTFESETKSGLVIVDFWAEWCGPCKAIGPTLEELAVEYAGSVKICKMNVDENYNIPVKFGVRSIPTLIAFKDGVKKDIKTGAVSKSVYKTWIDSMK
jgi:thioredoxin 1